jgi:hypothetical protein
VKSYDEIKQYFYNRSCGSSAEQIIANIFKKTENFISEKNIEAFYPKNLFLEDKSFELLLFCSDNHLVFLGIENSTFISMKYISLGSIDSVKMMENTRDITEKILNICFKNGECMEFNSKIDTNEYYNTVFSDMIDEICKYFLKRNW